MATLKDLLGTMISKINSKVTVDELSDAVDTALTQAKVSGEFDGPKGDTGDTGPQGDQGPKGDNGTNGIGIKSISIEEVT